jgi:hypothetical protein
MKRINDLTRKTACSRSTMKQKNMEEVLNIFASQSHCSSAIRYKTLDGSSLKKEKV